MMMPFDPCIEISKLSCMFESIHPATGSVFEKYAAHRPDEVEAIVAQTGAAAQAWAEVDVSQRAEQLTKVAEILEAKKEEFARLMTREMGKPITQARAEVAKCAWVCRYYAEHGPSLLEDEALPSDAAESFISYEPLGVVLAVMPWNFPFWQVFRFAAPALMAGNAGLLKHASNVCGCAMAIEAIFREAGCPADLFRTLLIPSDAVAAVIENKAVAAVTLTGSEQAGSAVAAVAGRAIKKTVLELGGSDPYLILDDADLDLAAAKCAQSRLINGGQSCIAAKRFLVHRTVIQPFTEKLIEAMRQCRMGDPELDATEIGPLARMDLRDTLHEQVIRSIHAGAQLQLGGQLPQGPGAYYPPTVLTSVRPGMPAFDEEIFGPVAAVTAVEDVAKAVRLANYSPYGLGAAVFTQDVARGRAIARKIQSGCCFINDFVKSDPRLPFGGIKRSGYGRELSKLGIREFVNVKTICVG